MLEKHDISVAGIAVNGPDAVARAIELEPDVILMDIDLSGRDGLAAARQIKAKMPETQIIILTEAEDDAHLFEAIKSGAGGYLLKSMGPQKLVEALEQVRQGTPPFSPGLAAKVFKEFARISSTQSSANGASKTNKLENVLNERQIEILNLISEGLSYKETASRLSISPRTVKYHMASITERLHLENRAQVLTYAGKMGIRNQPDK